MSPRASPLVPLTLMCAALVLTLLTPAYAFETKGTLKSYGQYPRWQACLNGSIGFEFKSNDPDGLLFYTDDGGQYDFFELRLVKKKMVFRYNLNETMGKIVASDYKDLNDNEWHNVTILRKQRETILAIDKYSKSAATQGLEFQFGDLKNNNYVYLGGMPEFYRDPEHLQHLALPSIMFEERWRGDMRNLQYSNCSCPLRVAQILAKEDAKLNNLCEKENPCDASNPNCDCLIDANGTPRCDCEDKTCGPDYIINYNIPFDKIINKGSIREVENPSQLKASVFGRDSSFLLRKGVVVKAMDFDGVEDHVTVEAARKDKTCFGSLKYCRDQGFTMGFWLFPRGHHHRRVHILSSGGYGDTRPGISVFYEKGRLYATVTTENEQQYRASLPIYLNRLYHVAFSWNTKDGLKLYLNGNLVDAAARGTRPASAVTGEASELYKLVIGKSLHGESKTGMKDAAFVMDDFNFWTGALTQKEIKDVIGPIVRMQLPFDQVRGNTYFGSHINAEALGNPKPSQYQGRVKQAIKLEGGSNQHMKLIESDHPCLVNLDECPHGMTLSFWAQFGEVTDNMYYLSSKNLQLFADKGHLVAQIIANKGEGDNKELRKWEVKSNKPIKQNKWYFVELSWDPDTDEMHLYLNDIDHATTSSAVDGVLPDTSEFFIGKAIDSITDGHYADIIMDEFEAWTADRQTLVDYNFIQRGTINHHVYYFDNFNDLTSNGLEGTKHGAVKIVTGKIDDAFGLTGKDQYVEFGNGEVTNWVGNLDAAPHGQLVAFWIKPEKSMNKGAVIYANNGVKVYVDQQKNIRAKFRTWLKEWDVVLPKSQLKNGEWNFVEFDIDPDGIIYYHLNSHVKDTRGAKNAVDKDYNKPDDNYRFFVGRPIDDSGEYAALNAHVDNLEIYEGRRDWLIAHGQILRGKPEQFEIGMDQQATKDDFGTYIKDVEPYFNVFTYNGVKLQDGFNGKAAHLDGQDQYIDLGDHTDVCFGDLKRCKKGFTMSHYFKINQLKDNMYILSSPGVNVFTKGEKLYVKVNSEGKTWEVPVNDVQEGKWYNLLYTWRKDKGLSAFLKEGSGITVAEHKNPDITLIKGENEVITTGFQNALIGKTTDSVGGTSQIDHDVISYHAAYLPELDVWPGGVPPIIETGDSGGRQGAVLAVAGLDVFSGTAMSLGEILGIISGVLLTLTSCALAAYYSGNAPCVTGIAKKQEGFISPSQIIVTNGKSDTDPLVTNANGTSTVINQQITNRNIENINVSHYNETNVNISNVKKQTLNIEEQELIQAQSNISMEQSAMTLTQNLLVGAGDVNSQNTQTAVEQESFNYKEYNEYNEELSKTDIVVTNEEENYNFRSSGRYSIYNEGTEIAENSQIVSVIITPDDKYVIAGSRHWPPQVWDIETGEIVHNMQSDTEGCSNLHLASGGRLLVGLVDILDAYESGGSTEGSAPEADRQLFQRLEVWNFRTGDPLTMSQVELCSKCILTKDRNSAIFARCDRYGNELSVVVWDLIQMRAMREVKCRSANLFCDKVDFLALSPNQDCAIVGYTNTKNGDATYVTFFLEKDINRTAEPKMVYMDANVDCSVVLNNTEAVTGTRSGELKLWNYRTGRTLRQLSGFTASRPNNDSFVAHQRAVTCMMLSENSRYLVSGSADTTVKVWNMDSERLLTTLKGHEDEVWCSAISPDNEFIVTGSKDKTIRLWRLATGALVCTFNTMVDIFQVFITSDKKTIVALGDREGSRILIMLKVVMQSTTVVRTRTESDVIDYE